jgi:hypothetical protein
MVHRTVNLSIHCYIYVLVVHLDSLIVRNETNLYPFYPKKRTEIKSAIDVAQRTELYGARTFFRH